MNEWLVFAQETVLVFMVIVSIITPIILGLLYTKRTNLFEMSTFAVLGAFVSVLMYMILPIFIIILVAMAVTYGLFKGTVHLKTINCKKV